MRDFVMTLPRLILSLLFLFAWVASSPAAERPNILILIADDLGWADVGYHGSEIETPNIDRLAKTGVTLEKHYVTPMCSSTRACLQSGRYSTRYGLDSATNDLVYPFGTTTLAAALQSMGYRTGITGKWHLGSKPEWGPLHFGFDHCYGALAGGIDQYLHLYKKGPYQQTWQRDQEFLEEEGHATDLFAREAIRWIEASEKDEAPFFIQVAYTAVHIPIQEPDEWVKPYEGKIENESRRRFAACATHMDHTIGQMVEALERTGQLDDTLIIFTSDNGGSGPWEDEDKYPGEYLPCPVLGLNTPLRGRKGTVYEGGIRVPAFVHWPKKLQPFTLERPIHVVDWMPTLLALTGYEGDTEDLKWDGKDIWPLLTGEVTQPEARTMYFKRGGGRALRHGPWKLVVDGKKELLFDLDADPNETTNLAEAKPDKVAELRGLLADEQAKDGPRALDAAP